MAKGLASRNRFREASGIFLLNSIIAAPRTTSVSSHEKHCVEKRTVNQQSVQPCDRVQPCTNLPSTACSSKCLASQEIVPLTTNVHPQKNHCGVWTSDSDRDGDGDDNGDVFCSAVGLPTLSVTEGGGRSHSGGFKHARVEPGAPSAPTNQGRGQHRKCGQFFRKNERERNPIHKTVLPIKRAPPFPKIILRSDALE